MSAELFMKKAVQNVGQAALGLERHYSVAEIAKIWALSEKTVQRMFEDEDGVLQWGTPETRRKRGISRCESRKASCSASIVSARSGQVEWRASAGRVLESGDFGKDHIAWADDTEGVFSPAGNMLFRFSAHVKSAQTGTGTPISSYPSRNVCYATCGSSTGVAAGRSGRGGRSITATIRQRNRRVVRNGAFAPHPRRFMGKRGSRFP